MKSRLTIKYSRYVIMTGAIAAALVGCAKGQNNQRIGQNANAPIPGTAPIAPNGIYVINGTPCNIHDLNPQSITSPLYQGPGNICYNPSVAAQPQQIVNQAPIVPGQQQFIPTGQQQIINQQGGAIVAPNYGVPPTHNDIPNDTNTLRIVGTQFQLTLGAYASQNASDTCALDKDKLDSDIASKVSSVGNTTTYDYVRFLTPAGSVIRTPGRNNDNPNDRFDLIFDPNGKLRVSAQSYIMETSSMNLLTAVDYNPANPPGIDQYALEQGANILHIGPFRMVGKLRQEFAQYETYLATILKRQELSDEKKDNDIDGAIPELGQSQNGSQLNQITFSGGHNTAANASSVNGGPDTSGVFRPQNLGQPHLTSPNVVTMDIAPISADMKLFQPNPQHITGLQINDISWHSYTNIDTTLGPDKCLDDSKGHFYNVFLK
jgi:hypothetical protein